MLNQETLLLVQVCITLLTTALLVIAASYADSPPELRWWAVGNVVLSAGMAMTNLNQVPPLLNSIGGYGVLALGMGLILRGLRLHCAATLAWRWIALSVLAALLIPAWFTLVVPSLRARLCFNGFYFGAYVCLCAATLARHGGWRGIGISVAGFSLLGMCMLLRGVYMLFHADPGEAGRSLLMRTTLLLVPLGQVCIAFGLILMVMWRYSERLRQLSTLDPLTGALNRAGLEAQGARVAQRTLRGGRSLTVIMIDVDHFKQINDTYGHPVGDEVLRHLARLLTLELRPHDLLARYGGEEFVLVLDGLNLDYAFKVAERLRERIAAALVNVQQISVRYTASFGVACSDQHSYDLSGLMADADTAMYAAKRGGRNRVVGG